MTYLQEKQINMQSVLHSHKDDATRRMEGQRMSFFLAVVKASRGLKRDVKL